MQSQTLSPPQRRTDRLRISEKAISKGSISHTLQLQVLINISYHFIFLTFSCGRTASYECPSVNPAASPFNTCRRRRHRRHRRHRRRHLRGGREDCNPRCRRHARASPPKSSSRSFRRRLGESSTSGLRSSRRPRVRRRRHWSHDHGPYRISAPSVSVYARSQPVDRRLRAVISQPRPDFPSPCSRSKSRTTVFRPKTPMAKGPTPS